jgi:hypothetical protein
MSDQLLNALRPSSADQTAHLTWLREEIGELRRQLAKTESELAEVPALRAQLKELIEVNDELVQLNNELQHRQGDYDELVATAARYTVVVESTSWKLTRPLRRIGELIRKLGR